MSEEHDKLKIAIDFLNLYQTQYSQTDKLWSYFSTISFGLIVLIIGGKSLITNEWHLIAAILGYLIFCIGNYQALRKAQMQLKEFSAKAMDAANNAGIPFETLTPFTVSELSKYYWPVVGVVIVSSSIIILHGC